MNFVCKNCNYRFESKLDQKGKSCPYCGNRSVIAEPTADDLLEEAE